MGVFEKRRRYMQAAIACPMYERADGKEVGGCRCVWEYGGRIGKGGVGGWVGGGCAGEVCACASSHPRRERGNHTQLRGRSTRAMRAGERESGNARKREHD